MKWLVCIFIFGLTPRAQASFFDILFPKSTPKPTPTPKPSETPKPTAQKNQQKVPAKSEPRNKKPLPNVKVQTKPPSKDLKSSVQNKPTPAPNAKPQGNLPATTDSKATPAESQVMTAPTGTPNEPARATQKPAEPTQRPATSPQGPAAAPTEMPVSAQTAAQQQKDNEVPQDFIERTSIFLEAGLGTLFAVPDAKLRDFQPKLGWTGRGDVFAELEDGRFIYSAGLGFFFLTASGGEPIFTADGKRARDKNNAEMTSEIGIRTLGTSIDLGASFRLRPDIFLGTEIQLRTPSDLGYSSLVTRETTGLLMGGVLGYDFKDEHPHKRIVLRIARGINNIDWNDIYSLIGFQVGLPIRKILLIEQETNTSVPSKPASGGTDGSK